MKFQEWWVSETLDGGALMEIRQLEERQLAEAAWNAALYQARLECVKLGPTDTGFRDRDCFEIRNAIEDLEES